MKVGSLFESYEEMWDALQELQRETSSTFYVRDSKSGEKAPRHVSKEIKFLYLHFLCVRGGPSQSMFLIFLVTELNLTHNHAINSAANSALPCNNHLQRPVRKVAQILLKSTLPHRLICRYIYLRTGKNISVKNLRSRYHCKLKYSAVLIRQTAEEVEEFMRPFELDAPPVEAAGTDEWEEEDDVLMSQ